MNFFYTIKSWTELRTRPSLPVVSVYERALAIIKEKDGISMRPTTGEFVIQDTLGTPNIVTIFSPKKACTCAESGNCYHELACDMAVERRRRPKVYQKRKIKQVDKRSGRKKRMMVDIQASGLNG